MLIKSSMVVVAVFMLLFGQAHAQVCNFAVTTINFGNVNIGPGGTSPTSGTFTASCTGIAGRTITICPNIGDGTGGSTAGTPRLLKNGAASMAYNLLQPNGQVWGSYVWPYAPRPPVLSLTLSAAGVASLSQPIQAAIAGSITSAPPGLYTSVYGTFHTLFDYGYAPGQSCTVVSPRAAEASFTVQANNTATCNVAVTAMNFGTIADLTTAQSVTNQIAITCTNAAAYTVGLSNGINGGSGPSNRFMATASVAQKLAYGIYKDSTHFQPWGSSLGVDTQAGTGTGSTQNLTAYALLPIQASPAPGTYSDTVVVTVNY